MNKRYPALLCTSLPILLLGACTKVPDSPNAKTNPNPIQRYEITVELIDSPSDIQKITGIAHFGVGTRACLPYREKIARVTIGASYEKEFPLVRTSENTYQGHVFLDWPIDKNYYGLGVCKWEIATVDTVITRESGLIQVADLNGTEVASASSNRSFCRKNMRDKFDKVCFTPIDPELIRELEAISYIVSMSSKRI